MIRRITKPLLIAAMLVGLSHARSSVCEAWSLNPFASSEKPQTTMYPPRAPKKPPSTWKKITTGTKNFFNKTGETLGLKKPAPKRPPDIVNQTPRQLVQQKKESKSWLSSLGPEEPPRDTSVQDWMHHTTQIKPE